MNHTNRAYFHADAALPFFSTRLASLLFSVGVSWCLFTVCKHFALQINEKFFCFASALAVVTLVEYFLTSTRVASPTLDVRLYFWIQFVVRLPRYWVSKFGRRWTRVAFALGSLGTAAGIIALAAHGWTQNAAFDHANGDLPTAGLSLALGTLAIFSTVVGLVVQSTLQDYSPSFLWVIVRNSIYITFGAMSLGIGLLNLVVLFRGSTTDLRQASLLGSLYCIASLPLLIVETLYYLDVSNVIRKIGTDTIRLIRRAIEEQPPIMSVDSDGSGLAIPISMQWRMFRQKWLFGVMSIRAAFPKFHVAPEITTALEERIRPITSTCLKSISLDRREVVLACLDQISNIAGEYINARKSYEGSPDAFLLFISGQVEVVFNAALTSANQQYTSDSAEAVAKLAGSALALTMARGGGYPENPHVEVFSRLLQKIAIQSFPLQHTNAPTRACEAIRQVGTRLLQQEAYVPVMYSLCERLATIGGYCASQQGAWPAAVTQAAVSGLVCFLSTSLGQTLRTSHHYATACRAILEKLELVIGSWYEIDHGHMENQTVIAPLVGGLWQDPKISLIFAGVLRETIPHVVILGVLEDLEQIARSLAIAGRVAIAQNRTPQYEYFEAFSEIVYETVRFAAGASEPQIAKDVDKFLDAIISHAMSLIARSYESQSQQSSADLFHASVIWAFLMHFYMAKKKSSILGAYIDAVRQLININEKRIGSDPKDRHSVTALYKYIKLFGAWLYRFAPDDASNKDILLFLAKKHYQQGPWGTTQFASGMASFGYPAGDISSAWHVYPSPHWVDQQHPVTQELNDINSYKSYDRLVRRIAVRLGTYVRYSYTRPF